MSSPASASAGASSLAGLSSSAEAAAVPTPEEACVYGKPNYQFVSTTTTHQQAAGQTPKPIAVIKFSHDGKTLATAGESQQHNP
jgi:hypothetical protein